MVEVALLDQNQKNTGASWLYELIFDQQDYILEISKNIKLNKTLNVDINVILNIDNLQS